MSAGAAIEPLAILAKGEYGARGYLLSDGLLHGRVDCCSASHRGILVVAVDAKMIGLFAHPGLTVVPVTNIVVN